MKKIYLMGRMGRLFFSLSMGSTISPIPPAVLINVIVASPPTEQLLSPDHKNAVYLYLALWGMLIWEPSLCAVGNSN